MSTPDGSDYYKQAVLVNQPAGTYIPVIISASIFGR
jgi:hypothetical protein